ncbi:LacI family DNA-binding transcriptional regulator [Streptomyces sp. NPDC056405]|uniref:LacI family DNA-binding transcriptional regulator n=1 Tax=Streptomyces sp. NPDC056405 TaxID=3345811 RepID=UPI0035DC6B3E
MEYHVPGARKQAGAESAPTRGGRGRRPRQAEVAAAAGVSQATVSLVLAGKQSGPPISEGTRNRVLEAARQLGYVHDPVARKLASARNNLLGVYSFTATFPMEMEHSYYRFLVGVEQEAARLGYDLVLFTASSSANARAAGDIGLSRMRLSDGCLLVGRHVPEEELRRYVADGFPIVHLGRLEESSGIPWVGADYVSASREVVDHLVQLGHSRIAYVREDDDAVASTDRQTGAMQALEAAGLRYGDAVLHRSATPAALFTPEWIRARVAEGVTAFVCEESDTGTAWRSLFNAARQAGIRCPDDVSLTLLGVPPADMAGEVTPTGFEVPRAELGAAAVRRLVALVEDRQADDEPLVPCPFRPGRTAGPASEAGQ